MTQDLQVLMLGEVMIAGPRGARRFIEGIPVPVERAAAGGDGDQ